MIVFDLECNGLDPDRIHCLSWLYLDERKVRTIRNPPETGLFYPKNIFPDGETVIGHNITRFDLPILRRLAGLTSSPSVIDTLGLSWYLYPDRQRHGLEWWGEEFGIPKPPIVDWDTLPLEEYVSRCEQDVRINTMLWDKMWSDLMVLYNNDEEAIWSLIEYIQFKMDCAREQERSGWKLDIPLCEKSLTEMEIDYSASYEELQVGMPNVPVVRKHTRPSKPFKKDGSWSVLGERWFDLLKVRNYPDDYRGSIETITGFKEANPGSSDQVKAWLFSMGWEPETFKYVKDPNNYKKPPRKIPQVRREGESGKELCPSVLKLVENNPLVNYLNGITVLSHRIGILTGFLKNVDDKGFVKAEIQGLANTLRFKHKTVVNLPGVDKPWGSHVRACLIAPEGYELMGSDMVALEDRTKQHYMYEYDPKYVEEMDTPGFDPHLDIALLAGIMTPQQVEDHKSGEQKYNSLRHKAKTTNYSCTYGIQSEALSRAAGVTKDEAQELIDTYWKRNWAILELAKSLTVKTIGKQKWLFNPVSRFWYSLRNEKDRFSTLNQGTATFVFDTWVKEILKVRPQLTGQFHDETIFCIKKGNRERGEKLLQDSIEKVNVMLGLNKQMAVEVQFGDNYAEIHG